jgi:hypothetical protein
MSEWKLKRSIKDAPNAVQAERLIIADLPDGLYPFEFTGKCLVNKINGDVLPLFRVDGKEGFINCTPNLPDAVKNSAVLFAENYQLNVSDGVYTIVPR